MIFPTGYDVSGDQIAPISQIVTYNYNKFLPDRVSADRRQQCAEIQQLIENYFNSNGTLSLLCNKRASTSIVSQRLSPPAPGEADIQRALRVLEAEEKYNMRRASPGKRQPGGGKSYMTKDFSPKNYDSYVMESKRIHPELRRRRAEKARVAIRREESLLNKKKQQDFRFLQGLEMHHIFECERVKQSVAELYKSILKKSEADARGISVDDVKTPVVSDEVVEEISNSVTEGFIDRLRSILQGSKNKVEEIKECPSLPSSNYLKTKKKMQSN